MPDACVCVCVPHTTHMQRYISKAMIAWAMHIAQSVDHIEISNQLCALHSAHIAISPYRQLIRSATFATWLVELIMRRYSKRYSIASKSATSMKSLIFQNTSHSNQFSTSCNAFYTSSDLKTYLSETQSIAVLFPIVINWFHRVI